MAALPEAVLSHESRGRIRLRLASKKRDEEFFKDLTSWFMKLEGIEKAAVNPATGSLLLIHAIDLNVIRRYAEEENLFTLSNGRGVNLYRTVEREFRSFDRQVRRLSGNELDAARTVSMILVGWSVLQVIGGNTNPLPWYTALWYGSSIFQKKGATG